MAQADPLLTYVNYGVLGLSVLALILGKVVPGILHDRIVKQMETDAERERMHYVADVDRERGRVENKDLEIARLNELVQDKVIPAIIRFTDAHAALIEKRRGGPHDG